MCGRQQEKRIPAARPVNSVGPAPAGSLRELLFFCSAGGWEGTSGTLIVLEGSPETEVIIMNRIISCLVALLIVLSLAAGAAAGTVIVPVRQIPEGGLAFTKADALAKAAELFAGRGYTYSEGAYFRKAGSVLLPDGQAAWIVFIERQEDNAAGNLYTVLSADTGNVIELYYPDNDVYTWIMMQWAEAKQRRRSAWSVEEQALFDWLFTAGSDMFNPSQAAVSSDEAVRIASDWVKEHFGIAYDDTGVSFIGWSDDSHTWYSWTVSFCQGGSQVMVVYVSTETGAVENSFEMSDGIG